MLIRERTAAIIIVAAFICVSAVSGGDLRTEEGLLPISGSAAEEELKTGRSIAEPEVIPGELTISAAVGIKDSGKDWDAMVDNKRALLSSLWAFASLNYLYCDVVGLMDSTMLNQYLSGTVGGMQMSEGFLLAATILMQVPLSMVFLTNLLDLKIARVANVAAGLFMTAIQTATLFTGKPTSYYLFSSIVEIATTGFIAGYSIFGLRQPKIVPSAAIEGDAVGFAMKVEL